MQKNISRFEGIWSSDFGILDLKQNGQSVEGTYSCCDGKITGIVDGENLKFTWCDPIYGEGWGIFRTKGTGDVLEGQWGIKNESTPKGKWNATRFREPEYKGISSQWKVSGDNSEVGGLNGTAPLYFLEKEVSGKLVGVYISNIQGQPMRTPVLNYLKGIRANDQLILNWENPMDGSKGKMEFKLENERFTGTWQSNDGFSRGKLTLIKSMPDSKESSEPLDVKSLVNNQAIEQDAFTCLKKGQNFLDVDNHQLAIDEFNKARILFEKSNNRQKLAMALYGLGQGYSGLGKFEIARQYYQQVLDMRTEIDETTKMLSKIGLESAQMMMGIDETNSKKDSNDIVENGNLSPDDPIELRSNGFKLMQKGDYPQAIEVLNKALKGYEAQNKAPGIIEYKLKSNLISIGNIYNWLAQINFWQKKFSAAIEYLEQSKAIWEHLDSPQNIAMTNAAIGLFQQFAHDFIKSKASLLKAIEIQQAIQSPDIWQTYYHLAKLYQETGELQSARENYRLSILKIEEIRSYLQTDETKIGYISQKISPFDDYITFLIEQKPVKNYLQEALEISEKARARGILELLAKHNAESMASHSDSVIAERFDEVISPLKIQTLRWPEIFEQIKKGETVYIDFYVTDNQTYIWMILPTGEIKFYTVSITKNMLNEMITLFHNDLPFNIQVGNARQLYNHLLADIISKLRQNYPQYRQLTFISHDILNSLPFNALKDEQDKYWGFDYEITYLPSLTSLAYLKPVQFSTADRFLLIGKPAQSAALQKSEEEIVRISNFFKNNMILMGEKASKRQILTEIENRDGIVFSTHGQADMDSPKLAYLELANEERLTLADILKLKLKAKMVVMSACETHVGKRLAGDELMTLSRGFLAAGSQYVLTTLWEVSELSAVEIISDFFESLTKGQSPAKALQMAQKNYYEDLKMSSKIKRPYYWTPFILIGKQL